MVPLIIPPHSVEVLHLLASPECRGNCRINADNPYVFANTKSCEDHTSGWHSLHRLMEKIDLKHPHKIKSSSNRHRLNTILASMDPSQEERARFYSHMGHSAKINETIYQAPPAVMELTQVGKHIMEIDQGIFVCILSSNK